MSKKSADSVGAGKSKSSQSKKNTASVSQKRTGSTSSTPRSQKSVAHKSVGPDSEDTNEFENEEARFEIDDSFNLKRKSPNSSKNVTFSSTDNDSEVEFDHDDEEETENESHNYSDSSRTSRTSRTSKTSAGSRKSNRKTSDSETTIKEGSKSASKKSPQKSRVSDAYDSLLDSGRRSDAVIAVLGGHNFHVHSAVLTARSPVLADMLDENDSKISLTEYDEDLFRHFLKFVYSGKLPKETIEENAFKLLRLSLRFQVEDLRKSCMRVVNKNMAVSNLMECILVADEFKVTRLKNKALKFANEHLEEVVDEYWDSVFQYKDRLMQFMKAVLPAKKETARK